MIPWHELKAEYRALPPFVKASLAVSAGALAFLTSHRVGETFGVALYYLLNS